MVNGFLPILGWPIQQGAIGYMLTIWFTIFAFEVIMTAFDPGHTMVIAGWNAFKYGCGVCMPAWALSQGALLHLVPHHGQWWQHWWVQVLILAGGLLLTLWMWLGEPIRGQISWKAALLPSKVYFQIATIWVFYLLVAVLLAAVSAVIELRFSVPWWAWLFMVVLVAAISGYAWSNKLDWGKFINQKRTPRNIELITFGLAALLAIGIKLSLDAGGVATVLAAGRMAFDAIGLP